MMIIYCRVDHKTGDPALFWQPGYGLYADNQQQKYRPRYFFGISDTGGTFERLTDGFRGVYWMQCSLAVDSLDTLVVLSIIDLNIGE